MLENITSTDLILALAGGFLPSMVWLWFWLREDRLHPEPNSVLLLTFIGGMIAVILSAGVEYLVIRGSSKLSIADTSIIVLASWAFIEELFKYYAAKDVALRRKSFDEPVDAMVYMITAALGFASLENVLFILNSTSSDGILIGMITGNMRFIGASLLHVATSSVVGATIAYSFFHKEKMHRNVIGGILLATFLHFIFNYSIINNEDGNVLKIFIPLWAVIIGIIFIFEKVKKIKRSSQ